MQIITPRSGGGNPANSGEDGDADDLAGAKDSKRHPTGAPVLEDMATQSRLAVKVWRLYFFTFRLY